MKKNHFVLAALLVVASVMSAAAQKFEGTIRWKLNYDMATFLKSEAMKESMQQASQMFGGADMNNPQMVQMIQGMLPQGFDMKIKEGNTLLKVKGGMQAMMGGGDVLYRKDKKQSYVVDYAQKMYKEIKDEDDAAGAKAKVSKTSETATIAGHKCTKYVVETSVEGTKFAQHIWTTTDIKDIDKDIIKQMNAGQEKASIFFEGMKGVPLKVAIPELGVGMEVTELVREKLNSADFVIPSDFRKRD
ncbi:protein of unknown function [Flexibacter flexilis DSM 6793]|uniref:Uncharacterized protein n=1 Tax=Flexibacter flexilis DSM 6793 TaxID=927664 RepID=A0A1I1DBL3_9BACT|nr:DUF4412 domain-containing protein [Flexibacter flexilis]SFB70478.1 protein of unknown function [Flexibacter flexilis DSM 6793]